MYIETSVVSYQVSRPSRDLVVAARQQITQERWERILDEFECFVSAVVVNEAGGGDPDAASARLQAISNLPALELDDNVQHLAQALVSDGPIPKQKSEDALHIAFAACNGIDYLLTWNFAHIHNALLESVIREVVEKFGFRCPDIVLT